MTASGPYSVGLTEVGESLKANPNEGGTGRMQSGSKPCRKEKREETNNTTTRETVGSERLYSLQSGEARAL
ncbi:hypothetical protein N7520_006532 [Penicillium odoratum]|uniref:uncharacterized protein n=1 Tax=Penicillium odoratum TaxID=1167516 RepID=UPI0025474DE6|nr:uncharacterized protein N7520_006532 [Penicillium odoratum]KAJ5759376.1 hypothetical protein N7520_006532 [Penicillium odoratum]